MYVHIRVLLSTSVQIIVLWWARCLLLATYQPTHYFCLAFREQFLQQRLSHCHPTSSSSRLGTAAGLQGNSDGKWSCLGRVPQFCEDTYIWMKTQSLENTPTGAFSMLKLLVMLSLGFEDKGFSLFHWHEIFVWGVFGQASQFQDNLFNAFIAKMCESTRPSSNSIYS